MTQVHTSVAKANSSKRGGQQHAALSLHIVWVLDSPREVFNAVFESLEGEDVADWVGTLVSGSQDGIGWARASFVVRNSGPAFKRVA